MYIKGSNRSPSYDVKLTSLKHWQTYDDVSKSWIKPRVLKSYILAFWSVA